MKPILLFTLLCCSIVVGWRYGIELGFADSFNSQAVRAIVGEAANQGAECMSYVAHAIRNRGTLKGVYGLTARHNDTEPTWVWEQAQLAWDNSDNEPDPTDGANGFRTGNEVPHGVNLIASCRDLYFYKTKQPRSSTRGSTK